MGVLVGGAVLGIVKIIRMEIEIQVRTGYENARKLREAKSNKKTETASTSSACGARDRST